MNTVLTIASGNDKYVRQAETLARSFRVWHPLEDIQLVIATDRPYMFSSDLSWAKIINLLPHPVWNGFCTKLQLDTLVLDGPTLFIDSDCLVFSHLGNVFEKFKGSNFNVVGMACSQGEFFGDISERCRRFGVDAVPTFVGSVYYMEPGELLTLVFNTARELFSSYDLAGFVRLSGLQNEEPLLSVSMALHGIVPHADKADIKIDAMDVEGALRVNCFAGCVQVAGLKSRSQRPYLRGKLRTPVVHFNGFFSSQPAYNCESFLLRKYFVNKWSRDMARLSGAIITMPQVALIKFKSMFRPIWHGVKKRKK